MKSNVFVSRLVYTVACLSILLSVGPALAKKQWTITQRQVALTREVDAGLKANELTLKEANKLRDRLADVVARGEKMKAKNGGKLSYEDEGKLEKDLNGISDDIHKKKLQKRVTAR